jgi:cytochrome c-type biogenesis protein CcmF
MLAAVATFASPFSRLAIPAIDGRGLLAILRNPAMLVHPPVLYLGHTVLLVPFAITAAALATRQLDRAWLQLVRRWTLIAWTALTLGMLGGSMWAYAELGWGGFWAWDSVENSALLPWLAATAFLHTARLQMRSGRLERWNAALAMLPFTLTLLGIYLTRSGLTGSVHAFADSSAVGWFTLSLFVAVVLVATITVVRYKPRSDGWILGAQREVWYMANSITLLWVILVVALGAAYPLLSRAGGDPVTVAARWYVVMVFPAALVVIAGVALAPWAGRSDTPLRRRVARFAVFSVAALAAMVLVGWRSAAPLTMASAGAGAVVVIGYDVVRNRRYPGRVVGGVAHLGLAILLVGAAGSSFGAEFHGGVSVGDEIRAGGLDMVVSDIRLGQGPDFSFVAAELVVLRGNRQDLLTPEWRAYDGSTRPTPEPALQRGIVENIVVAISRISDDASVVWLDVFVRPLIGWVWVGAVLLGFAGLLALATSVGSGGRRRRLATAAPQRAGTRDGMSNS